MASSPLDPANVSIRADRTPGRGHGGERALASLDADMKDGADIAPHQIEEIDLAENEEGAR